MIPFFLILLFLIPILLKIPFIDFNKMPVKVRIKKIDMNLRQMDLEMVDTNEVKPKPGKVKDKKI